MATLLAIALSACVADIEDIGNTDADGNTPDDTTGSDGPLTTGTETEETPGFEPAPPSAATPAALTIPTAHPRLWFTPDRLARAKTYFRAHTFAAPSSVADADEAIDAALHGLLAGQAASCRKAIDWAKSVEFSVDGVASDGARWDGEGVILTFDWCFAQMTAAEVTLLKTRWNHYIQTLNDNPWGGIGMEGNNYYTGYFRNTILWAIASYHENQPVARTFLDYALNTRWKTSLLPYLNDGAKGGAPGEGSSYGRRTFGYMTVPFTSLGLLGGDMWNQTTYFLETVFYSIYSTTPGVSNMPDGQKLFETFSYNEDERWLERDARSNNAQTTLGSYLAPLIEVWKDKPVAGYAKKFMDLTGARIENRFIEVVNADSVAGVAARDLSALPLDYYASGLGMLYAKNAWAPTAMMINQQFSPPTRVGHQHRDAGSFQIWRGGEFLSRETVGYAQPVADYGGSGEVDCESPVAHNTLLFGGLGTVGEFKSTPRVLRMSSTADATYAAVDLTGAYDVTDEWQDREAEVGNPNAGRVVRETLFIRPLEALVVFDRMESANDNAATTKSFLVHFPSRPTASGNSLSVTQGNQQLQVTTLVPATTTRRIVDESAGGQFSIGQFRAEIETSGQVVSHFLHVLQARDAGSAALQTSVTESATAYTVTLTHPTKGTAVVTLTKGIASTGGTFGFAARGTPVAAPLRADVQPMTVSVNGPAWGR